MGKYADMISRWLTARSLCLHMVTVVCVSERERECERECMCVSERESVYVCVRERVCVCVCVRDKLSEWNLIKNELHLHLCLVG